MEKDQLHYTHNPFLLPDIKDAIEIIQRISQKRGKAIVFGDKDVDGITSTALTVNFLESQHISTQYRVPEGEDRYGFQIDAITKAIEEGVDLIIAVDCGITQFDEIAYARDHQVPVIVIDHHDLREELPAADAIINPKRKDFDYPCKETCTCTLVAKLIFAYELHASASFMKQIFLLHSVPGTEAVICDGIILHAGVVQKRIHGVNTESTINEEIIQGYANADIVIVYSKKQQKRLLQKLEETCGKKTVVSLQNDLVSVAPRLVKMGVTELCRESRAKRYTKHFEEIDMLYSLYRYYTYLQESDAVARFSTCLDLVALATIADMVTLTDENRILLRKGLEVLTSQRRGVVSLLVANKLIELPLVDQRLSWTLIPTLNATGRMGQASVSVELFLERVTIDEKKEILKRAMQLNTQRKSLYESVMKQYQPMARESFQALDEKFILVTGKSIHRGITGIVANRIAEQYQRPCVCIAIEESICTGSIRSIGMVNSPQFLQKFSDLFIGWGGHHDAGGFSCYTEHVERLKDRVTEYIRKELYLLDGEDTHAPDCILSHEYLTPDILAVLDDCKPFGQGFRNPWFQLDAMKIVDVKQRGSENQHFLLSLEGGGFIWPAVFWNVTPELHTSLSLGNVISVLCTISLNVFRNQKKIQLLLKGIDDQVDKV